MDLTLLSQVHYARLGQWQQQVSSRQNATAWQGYWESVADAMPLLSTNGFLTEFSVLVIENVT